ncbi:MAG: nucleotide-binding protein [Nitrospirae bacterium]|nr:nucleotide-binding protein [Nitrospirota bacterium]
MVATISASEIERSIDALESAAHAVGKAWSGSWLGYHACVYYNGLKPPPSGAHFSMEYGLDNLFITTGEWQEYTAQIIEDFIQDKAGNPDLHSAEIQIKNTKSAFETDKDEVLSILSTELAVSSDNYLQSLKDVLEKYHFYSEKEIINDMMPSGKITTRDRVAASQGIQVPPHMAVLAKVYALREPQKNCAKLAFTARRAGSHIARKIRQCRRSESIGTNVFIGHGRSSLWKDLKDFIQDRLKLPWDEFNRISVAGFTNIDRLSEMLDAAAIAFLIMTGEDEATDGRLRARMNVVHEAGLFQGRLGFSRAIILLEDGCEEFSNIQGLAQIRFPKGNIKSAFEEIRQVLERKNILIDVAILDK